MANGKDYQFRHNFLGGVLRHYSLLTVVQFTVPHNGPQRRRHRVLSVGGTRMPLAPQDGHKPLHRGEHARNELRAAPCGAAPGDIVWAVLLRIAGVYSISRLFFQPPLEVLPSPANFIVQPALGDFDVLIGFLRHHNYVAIAAVVIADQVTGADLLPTRAVHPPPG